MTTGGGDIRRVALVGRPGAGKGVQGARLAKRLGVRHISTGDLLRDEIAASSPLGVAVERIVNAGRLVPTELILAVVDANLDPCGYVLDGFPRTVAQAEALFSRPTVQPVVAIEIVVSARAALDRLIDRARADDDPAVARARLDTYETETAPVLKWLGDHRLLLRVDGQGTPDSVERNLWHALQSLRRIRGGASLSDAWAIGGSRDVLPSQPV
jgi:adenylate kinase